MELFIGRVIHHLVLGRSFLDLADLSEGLLLMDELSFAFEDHGLILCFQLVFSVFLIEHLVSQIRWVGVH